MCRRPDIIHVMSRPRLRRIGLLFTAVFQLLFPAFASVADARAEGAAERGAYAHIETHGTSKCVAVHSEDCALCRVLAGNAAPTRAQAGCMAAGRLIHALPPRYVRVGVGTVVLGDPSQRAPPIE